MKEPQHRTTKQAASEFEVIMPLLEAMFSEFKEFSRKKPDAAIGKAKIAVVNRLLERAKVVLANEASARFLDLLDEQQVPLNSDVALMLSQWVAAMHAFRGRYFGWDGASQVWFTKG
jgi:hypothetical protein